MGKRSNEVQTESLEDETKAILEEARMVLPGIQTLLGFQLVAVFNARFAELPAGLQITHLVALTAIAVSMSFVMTPAAYHRIAARDRVSNRFVDLASRLVATSMAPLALSVSLETFIVMTLVTGSSLVGIIAGGFLALMFVGMWFLWPTFDALHRRH